jgi:micrococcal nuclease
MRPLPAILLCLALACGPETSPPAAEPSSQGAQKQAEQRDKEETQKRNVALVTRVVDGDTIEIQRGGIVDVRLIGIDTPETVHPTEPIECYGPAASNFTTQSLEGDRIRLEFDVERQDQYGRTLAYVWDDGKLFNQVLVEHGFATVTTYPPNVKHVERFVGAQKRARRSTRGLWGFCPAGGGNATAGSDSGSGSSCDSNYKGACIPPYPPDLDCDDVPSNFQSVGSDPHNFDGEGNGLACES